MNNEEKKKLMTASKAIPRKSSLRNYNRIRFDSPDTP